MNGPGATPLDVTTRAQILTRLELVLGPRLDGLLAGPTTTTALGPGIERAGAAAYHAGDDARLMDWTLTARLGEPHVRTTQAEREVTTWVVADRSPSLDFGTARSEKRDVVLGATAAFGMLSVRAGHRFGVVACGMPTLTTRPPRAGRDAMMAALTTVYDTPRGDNAPPPAGDLAGGLAWLARAARQRALVVVVSDFLGPDTWQAPLRTLGVRHQVVAVRVSDPRESALPNVGVLGVIDTETGRQRYVQTASATLRARYAAAAAAREAATLASLRAAGAVPLALSTDRDWLGDTIAFLATHRLSGASARGGLRAGVGR